MVISGVNTVTYNGNGSQTAWPFTFPIASASEIKVQLINADGTTTAVENDYYVDVVNNTVYYPGYAPGAEPPEADQPPKVKTGQKIEIYREVPMTQEANLGNVWPYFIIEKGLDKLTMICQQIYSYTNRKLDSALASMFQLAGIVTDSGKLQHITDQYNAIDANAAIASAAATTATNKAAAAATSATNAANSDASATATAAALTAYLADKETLTAPAVDATLTISGAAADAQVTGQRFKDVETTQTRTFFYNEAVTVDRSNSIAVNIPAGEYCLYIDNTTSTDTQYDNCRIIFYYDGGGNTSVEVPRNTRFERKDITFSDSVNQISFYAAHSYSDSAGFTAEFDGVRLYQTTKLREELDNIENNLKDSLAYEVYTGNNVEFYPGAVRKIDEINIDCPPIQAGSGNPSPSNIRALSIPLGTDITINGTSNTVTFVVDGNFYGGYYDYVSGTLVGLWRIYDIATDLRLGWSNDTRNGLSGVTRNIPTIRTNDTMKKVMCSHLWFAGNTSADAVANSIINTTANFYNIFLTSETNFTNVTTFLDWVDAQKLAGTPVQFATLLSIPYIYKLTPQEVNTVAGKNVLTSSNNIEVKLKIDLNDLKNDVSRFTENTSNILNRVNGKYISHIGVSQSNNIIIPSQSLADVDRARRLGFNTLEINVRKTFDGKYVCLHGSSGKFGPQFTDLNGDSVENVVVSSMTLADIKSTIRYKSNYARYRTAPFTLQEMLYECKRLGIIPLVEFQSSYTDEIEILDSIMGKNNYMIGSYRYNRDEIKSEAPMMSWLSYTDPEDIINKCNASGGMYVAGLDVTNSAYDSFTESDWKNLVNKVHEQGYTLGYAYAGQPLNQLLLKCGFDVVNTSYCINEIENPNLLDIVDTVTFDGFTTTGQISNSVLTLSNGDTVQPTDDVEVAFLGGGSLHVCFDGQITVEMGTKFTGTFTSDGALGNWFSTYYEESKPTFKITSVGTTTIKSLSFKSSKV